MIRSPAGAVSTAGSAKIIAPLLEVEARDGIDLNTHVDDVIARTLGTGDIRLVESDNLTLTDVEVADGVVDVTCGGTLTAMSVASSKDIDGNDVLLTAAGDSRGDRCEAHFFVGLNLLADGHRAEAAQHFQKSVETRVFEYFEHGWSRAFLARLRQDPTWPPWIPLKEEPATQPASAPVGQEP